MARPIRTLVVDDEPIARRTLRLLIAADPELELVADCDALAAVESIERDPPDLLFLDVQMPDLDGFALLERVGVERVPAVVFVTAFQEHALRAFEVDAVDYLLKPFDDARFATTLRRVKAALASQIAAGGEPTAGGEAPRPLRRLLVRSGERLVLVPVAAIQWIEAADYYVRIHAGGKSHLLRQTMAELERALDPQTFFRIHRSAIVNLDCVRELVPHFHGEHSVVLHTGTRLRLGRGRLEELQRRLLR